VAEAPRFVLGDSAHGDQLVCPPHLRDQRVLAPGGELLLQFGGIGEVCGHRVLSGRGDDQQLLGARIRGLGGHELDARRVDDRQQFFGYRFGCRQEPCAQAGGRHHRGAEGQLPRHTFAHRTPSLTLGRRFAQALCL
jgi:hypothetical protein